MRGVWRTSSHTGSLEDLACVRGRRFLCRSRKALLLIMMVLGLVLYLGPSLFRWVRHKTPIMIGKRRMSAPFPAVADHKSHLAPAVPTLSPINNKGNVSAFATQSITSSSAPKFFNVLKKYEKCAELCPGPVFAYFVHMTFAMRK